MKRPVVGDVVVIDWGDDSQLGLVIDDTVPWLYERALLEIEVDPGASVYLAASACLANLGPLETIP